LQCSPPAPSSGVPRSLTAAAGLLSTIYYMASSVPTWPPDSSKQPEIRPLCGHLRDDPPRRSPPREAVLGGNPPRGNRSCKPAILVAWLQRRACGSVPLSIIVQRDGSCPVELVRRRVDGLRPLHELLLGLGDREAVFLNTTGLGHAKARGAGQQDQQRQRAMEAGFVHLVLRYLLCMSFAACSSLRSEARHEQTATLSGCRTMLRLEVVDANLGSHLFKRRAAANCRGIPVKRKEAMAVPFGAIPAVTDCFSIPENPRSGIESTKPVK
jgi:hypothetical protein